MIFNLKFEKISQKFEKNSIFYEKKIYIDNIRYHFTYKMLKDMYVRMYN